jgi:hypothetical protein
MIDEHIDAIFLMNNWLDSPLNGSIIANIHFDEPYSRDWLCFGDTMHRTKHAASPLG